MEELSLLWFNDFAELFVIAEAAECDELCSFIVGKGVVLSMLFADLFEAIVGICETEVGEGAVDGGYLFAVLFFEVLAASEEILLGTIHNYQIYVNLYIYNISFMLHFLLILYFPFSFF